MRLLNRLKTFKAKGEQEIWSLLMEFFVKRVNNKKISLKTFRLERKYILNQCKLRLTVAKNF